VVLFLLVFVFGVFFRVRLAEAALEPGPEPYGQPRAAAFALLAARSRVGALKRVLAGRDDLGR
jgi:hypothetical protein